MKFASTLVLTLILALPSLSLPAPSNQLIRGLVQSKAFNRLLESPDFDGVEITRIPITDAIRQKCQEYSRSAAALSVIMKIQKNSVNFIFVTSESEDGFRYCH